MLLSEIVKRVNAKSFGETDYDYDDIYPYFQEAIDSLNSQLDVHRRVADAPRVYAEDAEYNFLLDIYINNYIITYIVVAMDNASLSVTSRTQTYAAQLEQYKTQTISDLYKWMPVKSTGASMAFDLTGYAGAKTLDVPQVKAWYDESIGGKLSGYGSPIPTKGVRWDNPYGTLVVHPKYADYRMKPGSNLVPYVFIPNEYFRQYYKNTIAYVSFYGHNIDFPVRAALNNAYDIGNRAGLNALLLAAWTVLKDDYGMPLADAPSVVTGSYTDDQGTESVMILQHGSGLCFYDIDTGAYYLAAPVDLSATPVEFNKTEIIINSVDLRLQEMQDEFQDLTTQLSNFQENTEYKFRDVEQEIYYKADRSYVDENFLKLVGDIIELPASIRTSGDVTATRFFSNTYYSKKGSTGPTIATTDSKIFTYTKGKNNVGNTDYEIAVKNDLKQFASKTYVDNKFNQILGEGASEILDTIDEISKALEEHNDEYDSLLVVVGDKANKKDVMDIVNENSTEVDTLNIGTSDSYDETSDNEIPTTKAVKQMIGSGGSSSGGKLYNHDIRFSDWDCDIGGYININLSTNTPITSLSQLYNIYNKIVHIPCFATDDGEAPDDYTGVLRIENENLAILQLTGTNEDNTYQQRYHRIVDFRIMEDKVTEV